MATPEQEHQRLLAELYQLENKENMTLEEYLAEHFIEKLYIGLFIEYVGDQMESTQEVSIQDLSVQEVPTTIAPSRPDTPMDISMHIDSLESSAQSISVEPMHLKRLAEDPESIYPEYTKIRPLSPKPTHKKKDKAGYQLFSSKLRIGAKPLTSIFPIAQKTLTTKDWKMAHEEVRLLNVLERIDILKESNLWSFKQLKPQVHPPRTKVLWDYLLEEMEWLSEDFRQEREWKKQSARRIAFAVLDWHRAEDKPLHTVKSRPIVHIDPSKIPEFKKTTVPNQVVPQSTSISGDGGDTFKAPLPVDPKVNQVDPKSVQVYINPESGMYMVEENQHFTKALGQVPTFERPRYAVTDLYVEPPDTIIPVSKFMGAEYTFKDINNFDCTGKNVQDIYPSPPVKRLGGLAQYEETTVPGVLFKSEKTDDIPAPHSPDPDFPPGPWTTDEEDSLWSLAETFSFNWELIAESLNSTRLGSGSLRTDWCCYNKFQELKVRNYTPQSKGDHLFTSQQTNKKEKKIKVLGMLSTFNYISTLAKKREAGRPVAKSNKQVNLTAHETHTQAQVQAGIDINANPLTPSELVKIKEQRDKLLEQSRQSAFFGARPMMNTRPLMRPMVRPPVNVPQPGFRPAFQGSPQERMAMAYTPDQLQKMLLVQQQRMLQQGRVMANGVVPPNNGQMAPALQGPTDASFRPRATRQIQVDVSTAAAFVALQNAQNAAKMKDTTSETGSVSASTDKKVKKEDDSSLSKKKKAPAKPAKRAPPTRRASTRRASRIQISESEDEPDELEESEHQEEEDTEEDELNESESEPEVKPTRNRRSSRSTAKKG